jgi:uncharacterized protein YegL
MSEQQVPELLVEGGTYYGEAFRALAVAIGQDTARLRWSGRSIRRSWG